MYRSTFQKSCLCLQTSRVSNCQPVAAVLSSMPHARFFQRAQFQLQKIYAKQPLLANSTTGWFLFAAGDVISQAAPSLVANETSDEVAKRRMQEEDAKKVGRADCDWARAAKVGLLGIALNGFALHGWYRILDRTFGSRLDSWRVVFPKVLADQVFYAPFACGSFLVWASVLQVTGLRMLSLLQLPVPSRVKTNFMLAKIPSSKMEGREVKKGQFMRKHVD